MHWTHLLACLALTALAVASPRASAWGERGHDLIARVATRVAIARAGGDPSVRALLGPKEHMLGHLSNIPDILWRNLGKDVEKLGAPTHYVDIEYLTMKPSLADFPLTIAAAETRMRDLCAGKAAAYVCPTEGQEKPQASHAGTAPWRVRQFFERMRAGLSSKAIDAALVDAGLMAHYVGDLGNPHHTSRDFNGFERGQGGIHSYVESDIVSSYGFDLDPEVLAYALEKRPFDTIAKGLADSKDPLAVAIALTLDSHSRLEVLNELDRQHAVTKASSTEKGMKLKAERKEAATVNGHFRPLVVERLATAADTLAHLWLTAWKQAGSPDLREYQSYAYVVAPEFVPPDYMTPAGAAP
jgi:hypothetical protein